MDTNEARRVIEREEENRMHREFDGKNWPFHFKMKEFQRDYWRGVSLFPNLREMKSDSKYLRHRLSALRNTPDDDYEDADFDFEN